MNTKWENNLLFLSILAVPVNVWLFFDIINQLQFPDV